ncbi:MAG TPA: aspartate aminotransferase family protein [Chloroflexota bacterium]|nr:aspartate aminotransferase family protein [Chloroflexota bacterium]
MDTIDRSRLGSLTRREQQRFVEAHPTSRALAERARASLFGGVPMPWMVRWPGGFPVFVREATGATVIDVDGRRYVDLCLGDTGAMTGHSPTVAVEVIQAQARRGLTTMLPTEDAIWVGEELARRFGLPSWQFTLSATDANRFALRLARAITGRPKVLVYNYCYHGTVDETVAILRPDGATGPRAGNLGPSVDPAVTTKVVEFNDLPALEAALGAGDVACVLAEPALTNVGIVLPDPGYHAALRDLTRRTGALLIIDETHTFCAGPGGYTRACGLEPDMLTIGKPIGSGIASGALGVSAGVAEQFGALLTEEYSDVGGIGGTLAGNALSLAAIRATLSQVLTHDAFAHMIALGERFTAGVEAVIRASGVPWQVTRLGCRAEYQFRPTPPRTGAEAAASFDDELDRFMHLYALNRGILLTPFHMMALMSPATTAVDVDLHTAVFAEAVDELLGRHG